MDSSLRETVKGDIQSDVYAAQSIDGRSFKQVQGFHTDWVGVVSRSNFHRNTGAGIYIRAQERMMKLNGRSERLGWDPHRQMGGSLCLSEWAFRFGISGPWPLCVRSLGMGVAQDCQRPG